MKTNTYVEVQARGVTQSNELEKPAPHKARTPARKGPTEWLVIIGLLLLSFIPIAGGAHRLTQLTNGTDITPANARFFASPPPVVVHIVSSSLFAILGAFQFATSLVAAGATHVQGTLNGYGERTGNADLVTIIANLELKKKKEVLPQNALREAFRISHAVAEVTNISPSPRQPYTGVSAFAHKAGLHASAIKVDPSLYQHEDPESVGNDMRMLVSDMAGRASIELKSMELGVDLGGDRELIGRVVDRVKDMESRGFTFEAADASFELLLREEATGKRPSFFTIDHWLTTTERNASNAIVTKAEVTVTSQGKEITCSGAGNGPVNAFDNALRDGLHQLYPELAALELTDYKVRILEGRLGTGAVTRVLVETSDGKGEWNTVGVHENVIAASAMALEDALTFGLLRQGRRP